MNVDRVTLKFFIIQSMITVTQFLSAYLVIVLFVANKGAVDYGKWLLASSIASLVAMIDFGIPRAWVNSELTKNPKTSNFSDIECVNLFKYEFSRAICLMIIGILAAFILRLTEPEIAVLILLFFVFQAFRIMSLALEAITRSRSRVLGTGLILLESFLIPSSLTLLLLLNTSLEIMAAVIAIIELMLLTLFLQIVFSNRNIFGHGLALWNQSVEVKRLFKKHISQGRKFQLFPLGNLSFNELSHVLVGTFLGAETLTTYRALKLIPNLFFSASGVVTTAFSVNLRRISGEHGKASVLKHKYVQTMLMTLASLMTCLILSFLFFGNSFYLAHFESLGIASRDAFLLSIVSCTCVIWTSQLAILSAQNQVDQFSFQYLITNIAYSILVVLAIYKLGNTGFIMCLVVQAIFLAFFGYHEVIREKEKRNEQYA